MEGISEQLRSRDFEGDDDLNEKFLQGIPKAELHAHLNGSLSKFTIANLCKMKNGKDVNSADDHTKTSITSGMQGGSLDECFNAFKLIHSITETPSSIRAATEDVIADFYNDGVRYLELRSTPREVPDQMSRSSYVDAMLAGVDKMKHALPAMMVKLLLSIDRKNSSHIAEETLKIAESHFLSSSSTIVGIDLSGNPSVGNVIDFVPILQRAKQIGLKLSLHMAEVADTDDEVAKLLALQPDRIGHGVFIHPMKGGCDSNFKEVRNCKIPLEMCLTSNVLSGTVSSYEDHHFPLWYSIGHPCIICTDDKGVFGTSLTKEYFLAQKHFSLSVEELCKLSYASIDFSFASNSEKQALKELWKKSENILRANQD